MSYLCTYTYVHSSYRSFFDAYSILAVDWASGKEPDIEWKIHVHAFHLLNNSGYKMYLCMCFVI